jgi:hypothetical protein
MGDAVGHHAVVEGDPGHLELAPLTGRASALESTTLILKGCMRY